MPPKKKIVPVAVSDEPSKPISGAFASAFAKKPEPKKVQQGGTEAQRKHLKRMKAIEKAAKSGKLDERYKSKGPRGIGRSSKRGIVRLSTDGEKITKSRVKRMNISQKKRLQKALNDDLDTGAASKSLFRSKACPVYVKAHCRQSRSAK